MDALEKAAVEAIREENGHLLPCTVAAKWELEEPIKQPEQCFVLNTLHGKFSVGKTESGRTYIYYSLTLCEFVPISIDDAKRECVELFLPQLEEVLDEVRVLVSMNKGE